MNSTMPSSVWAATIGSALPVCLPCRHFFARLTAAGKDSRSLAGAQLATVGPATAEALRAYHLHPDFQPQEATGAALADSLPGDLGSANILIPRALAGDEAFIEQLEERGAIVDAVPAYENVLDGVGAENVRKRLTDGTIDVVTFTSSSTVKNFVAALAPMTLPPAVQIVCIGPSTAKTASELLGRQPDAVASVHTLHGLLTALEELFSVT